MIPEPAHHSSSCVSYKRKYTSVNPERLTSQSIKHRIQSYNIEQFKYNSKMPCPYALQDECNSSKQNPNLIIDPSISSSSTTTSSSSSAVGTTPSLTPAQALQLAKQSCPAFASNCPFRSVASPEDMKNTLKNMPPSHLNIQYVKNSHPSASDITEGARTASITAQSLLQHVHDISRNFRSGSITSLNDDDTSVSSARYSIPGGCPFKTLYSTSSNQGTQVSFVNAMEEFSLSALMAAMIQKEEENGDDDDDVYVHVSMESKDDGGGGGDDSHSRDAKEISKSDDSLINTSMKRSSSKSSLSHALKHGTQESHTAAESVHFVKEFIHGNIDRTLYSKLILNLFHVYKHLESHLDQHAPQYFPTLHFPKELNRSDALRDDVDFYHGSSERVLSEPPSKATQDYIHRLEFIAQNEPLLLLSHAYTRYLGDLSGGKVLARVAKRALHLNDTNSGLAFYQFDEIPSAKLFKDAYRISLDELDLSDKEIERLVAEANVAFVLNMRIFEELDVLSGKMDGKDIRSFESAVSYYDKCIQMQAAKKNSISTISSELDTQEEKEQETFKCPFAKLGGPNPHLKIDEESKYSHNVAEQKPASDEQTDVKNDNEKGSDSNARCPWPFIFFHDPATGMKDYQTWVVIAIVSCYAWRFLEKKV